MYRTDRVELGSSFATRWHLLVRGIGRDEGTDDDGAIAWDSKWGSRSGKKP